MKESGFTLLEVMVALFIFSVVIGLGYGLLISVEQVNLENRIYFQVIHFMQNENMLWRSNQHIESKTVIIDQVILNQYVDQYVLSPHIERAEITYRWKIGKKEYHAQWHLDRFVN